MLDDSLRRAPYLIDAIDIMIRTYPNHATERDGVMYFNKLTEKLKGDILNYGCYLFLMDPGFHSMRQLAHFQNALNPYQILHSSLAKELRRCDQ
eukprot:TsM_000098000 transcript=TsM_000098000 gene=TsM_000098000